MVGKRQGQEKKGGGAGIKAPVHPACLISCEGEEVCQRQQG